MLHPVSIISFIWLRRYEQKDTTEDLDRCIAALEEILNTAAGEELHDQASTNLITALLRRFMNNADIDDLDNAVLHGERALRTLDKQSPHWANALHNTTCCLIERFS